MADFVVTPANVAPVYPKEAEIFPAVAAVDISAGDVVYFNTSGKVALASAAAAGALAQPRGIALQTVKAESSVEVLKSGHVSGFTISQAYETRVFLSNTAGKLADAAGTVSAPAGRVVSLSDKPTYTKMVYVDFNWSNQN